MSAALVLTLVSTYTSALPSTILPIRMICRPTSFGAFLSHYIVGFNNGCNKVIGNIVFSLSWKCSCSRKVGTCIRIMAHGTPFSPWPYVPIIIIYVITNIVATYSYKNTRIQRLRHTNKKLKYLFKKP